MRAYVQNGLEKVNLRTRKRHHLINRKPLKIHGVSYQPKFWPRFWLPPIWLSIGKKCRDMTAGYVWGHPNIGLQKIHRFAKKKKWQPSKQGPKLLGLAKFWLGWFLTETKHHHNDHAVQAQAIEGTIDSVTDIQPSSIKTTAQHLGTRAGRARPHKRQKTSKYMSSA